MAAGGIFKKGCFLSLTMLLGLLSGSSPNLYCQKGGIKYLKNYSQKDYGEQKHPQNWSVLQDNRGIIYAGNQAGLLEFDGVSWRSIDIPNGTVRSMAVDDRGTIYIGGDNQIGFLAPDSMGTLKYHSLLEQLKENEKSFSIVWKTHATEEGVYLRTTSFLFKWNNKKMKPLPPPVPGASFGPSFICRGKLYVRQDKIGLMQIVNDQLTPVPGGEFFADKKIFMMMPYDSQRLLIGTRYNGFYTYEGIQAVPFPTGADEYVKENRPYHGIRLSSSPGDFAIATIRGGLVIIDSRGRLKDIFTKDHGLLDNNIKYIFEDSRGNLWLALNKGIAKIEYVSPIASCDDRSNLPGLILSVIRHGPHNNLCVGTTDGLYFPGPDGKFHRVSGVPEDCFSILSMGDSLLAATSNGVFQVGPQNDIKPVIKNCSFVLLRSQIDTNRIWVGTHKGLISLYLSPANENGQWRKEYKSQNITQEIRTIVEEKNGDLWLGTLTQGVLKVNLPSVTLYGQPEGLPTGEVNVVMAAGHVMFTTNQGIYRFDKKTGTFLPDNTLGDAFAGGVNGKDVFRIVEDKNKNLWFHSNYNNLQAIPTADSTFMLIQKPFLRIPRAEVNVIYPDPDGDTVWFGGNDGLVRFDTTVKRDYHHDFTTLIRRVIINGKPVFNGCKNNKIDNDPRSAYLFPVIDYEDRNIRFEFAAPFFENESATQYHHLLEGYDNDWSDWTSEFKKDYTNLDAGTYRFRVQAKNVYGNKSHEAVFRFKVLPPWYKTWWAFSAYALLLFLLMFYIIKWRSGKLEREKHKLERVVKERTKEIEEKKQQLEEQAEKLKEMDKVKSRFFANISHEFRTPLTLIMGPLEHMLSRSRDKEQQKCLNLMLRNSQRLLGLINQLLELSKFESHKMKFQVSQQNIVPFLKGIVTSFEPVADKNEVNLNFRAEGENITLYFDPGKLEEAIFNLLSNAVKFTPPGGQITVGVVINARKDENFPSGSLDLSVSDTGPGIPRDQLAHIFDRFYQSDSTYEHHRKGSGIGLSIAKALVELHHGKINVHSHEGKGTEFIIRLPMGKAHLEPDEILEIPLEYEPLSLRRIPAEIPSIYSIKTGQTGKGEEPHAAVPGKESDPLKPGKDIILVVEDSTEVRDYIRGALEPHYIMVDAGDGREGIQKALEIIPDLIISDIMMPGVDGYELCRQLKNNINTSHVPILLLTAKASEESILQGLETGADDYVTKPFNTKILCARIKNLIDLRRHMQQTLNREMTMQPVRMPPSQMDNRFIKKLKEVLKTNISDPDFNIEQLCRKMDMSQPTIYRKIHALTGESPTEFIRSYRLKQGAELLKNKSLTVLEVAFEVGFSSATYFTKCFKQKFHMLPSSYQAAESQ